MRLPGPACEPPESAALRTLPRPAVLQGGRYQVHAMFFAVEPDAYELARLAEMAETGKLPA